MTTKRRLQFECWKCEQEFSLTNGYRNIHGKFVADCPYCDAVCVVDLAPFRNSVEIVAKSVGPSNSDGPETLTLPDLLVTRAATEADLPAADEEDS